MKKSDKPKRGRPVTTGGANITPKWQFRCPTDLRQAVESAATVLGEDSSAFARRVLAREAEKVLTSGKRRA